MDKQELLEIANRAGFKIRADRQSGCLVVDGDSGLTEQTLAKFAELIADRCAEIAGDGQYGCHCGVDILRQMMYSRHE